MAERDRPNEGRPEPHDKGLQHDEIDVGTGLGGGVAPVLPTDIDGENPDSEWLASSDKDTAVPNWTAAEEVSPGLERMDQPGEPLRLGKDTHIVTVFGEDLGKIETVYGYSPSTGPQWASIKDGDHSVLVPLMSGQLEDDGIHVPYPKNLIESAPAMPDHDLTLQEEMAMYAHYNERRILPAAEGDTQDNRTLRVLSQAA
jgi:hypothetical protein